MVLGLGRRFWGLEFRVQGLRLYHDSHYIIYLGSCNIFTIHRSIAEAKASGLRCRGYLHGGLPKIRGLLNGCYRAYTVVV